MFAEYLGTSTQVIYMVRNSGSFPMLKHIGFYSWWVYYIYLFCWVSRYQQSSYLYARLFVEYLGYQHSSYLKSYGKNYSSSSEQPLIGFVRSHSESWFEWYLGGNVTRSLLTTVDIGRIPFFLILTTFLKPYDLCVHKYQFICQAKYLCTCVLHSCDLLYIPL